MHSPADRLRELLELRLPPVAVAFRTDPPPGIPRIDRAVPSSCSFWKLAAEGHVFYTEAEDHWNCPIGAYTHAVELPLEKQTELQGLIGTMVELQYLRESEVAEIPRRSEPFRIAIYAPWESAPCEPDVVLVCGNAKQTMVLVEAVRAAGIGELPDLMGRPTCAMIPAVIEQGRAATSLGCIGNRVYTGMTENELYAAIPGPMIESVVNQLSVIVEANATLKQFHRQRAASIRDAAVQGSAAN